jgi:hypothetical protein
VENYNSSYHSSIKKSLRLEIFDEVDLIRESIVHNNRLDNNSIKRDDFVRLLNQRGAFEKEGQRFTCKIYLVEEVGLNSIRVQDKEKKYNLSEILKVSAQSQDIDNSLRQKQLGIFRVDKQMREREGIEPNRRTSKRTRR